MPLQQTSGNDTADAYGGGVAAVPTYIEDVFSTYLYDGNATNRSIVNNIDLSTKGGLVWIKSRTNAVSHALTDTVRGVGRSLSTNTTGAQSTLYNDELTAFNATGFSLGADVNQGIMNLSGQTYASWAFRKQPKFFDVVTYTGTGSNTTIAHNLGSVPGCIIVKRTDTTGNWQVYHNGLTSAAYSIQLNLTNAQASATTVWNSTTPTSTVFSLGTDATVNASGGTYVAYLFAHNAGGFGLTGTDNVILCGSGVCDSNGYLTASLGFEPQWVLVKGSTVVQDWYINDSMRGMTASTTGSVPFSNTSANLQPNLSNAESTSSSGVIPNATGFTFTNGSSGQTYIYIAIRRGPMKVPTDGTKVFTPAIYTPTSNTVITTNFPVDLNIGAQRNHAVLANTVSQDRLRGGSSSNGALLYTNNTDSEFNPGFGTGYASNTSITDYLFVNYGYNSPTVQWLFRRAPGFFDEVCYTGTGAVGNAISHNLGVAPELAIFKGRTGTVGSSNWSVFTQFTGTNYVRAFLQITDAGTTFLYTNNAGIAAVPTSTTITVDNVANINNGSTTYVAYLFATCPGVSKVGSYTGTGATQTISCGFTGGARFVLIKRTDTTGNWYVWDTARGMVSGTDPSLLLNSTAAEVNANSIYTATGGFQIVSTAAGINASGGTYIFLAIA